MNELERLSKLESELTDLRSQLSRISQLALPNPGSDIRIGEVVNPSPGTGDTFQWKPKNGTFTEALNNTASYVNRQTNDLFAASLDGTQPADTTKGIFFKWSQRWWFQAGGGQGPPGDSDVKLIRIKDVSGGTAACTEIGAQANGIYDAKLVTFPIVGVDVDMDALAPTEGDDIFAFVSSDCVADTNLKHDEVYIAYKVGSYEKSGAPNITRDIYAVSKEKILVRPIRVYDVSMGTSTNLTIVPNVKNVYDAKLVTFPDGGLNADLTTPTVNEGEDIFAYVGDPIAGRNIKHKAIYIGVFSGETYDNGLGEKDLYLIFPTIEPYWGGWGFPSVGEFVVTPGQSRINVTKGFHLTRLPINEVGWSIEVSPDKHFKCQRAGHYQFIWTPTIKITDDGHDADRIHDLAFEARLELELSGPIRFSRAQRLYVNDITDFTEFNDSFCLVGNYECAVNDELRMVASSILGTGGQTFGTFEVVEMGFSIEAK